MLMNDANRALMNGPIGRIPKATRRKNGSRSNSFQLQSSRLNFHLLLLDEAVEGAVGGEMVPGVVAISLRRARGKMLQDPWVHPPCQSKPASLTEVVDLKAIVVLAAHLSLPAVAGPMLKTTMRLSTIPLRLSARRSAQFLLRFTTMAVLKLQLQSRVLVRLPDILDTLAVAR